MLGQVIAQDVDAAQPKVMAAPQKPFNQSILAKNLVFQLGNNYLVGTESLRMTMLSRLIAER